MKAEINFPEYGKNVGATIDLNSVHRFYFRLVYYLLNLHQYQF